jgi:hypothetical protein
VKKFRVLDVGYLNECFSIDMERYVLIWKTRPESHFKDLRSRAIWNTKYSGKEAGCLKKGGYLRVGINNSDHLCHRIIFALITGKYPELEIDHIDGNTSNNRIENLREVSHSDNLANQKKGAKNTSGVIG